MPDGTGRGRDADHFCAALAGAAAPDGCSHRRSDRLCKALWLRALFRMLAAGAGALLPPMAGTLCAMLLEVCSGCDLAARTGRWASLLCCAALSVQGLSVLLQVRALCPPEMTLRPLYTARLLHLPLSLGLFYLLLPSGEQSVFSTLPPQVVPMRRLPPDCLLLVFFVCCLCVCELSRLLQKPTPEPKETVVNRRKR